MLTPNNQPRKVLSDPDDISDCWITASSYPNLAKYSADPTLSPFLNSYIIEACAFINDLCKTKFNEQQADFVINNKNLYIGSYTTIVLPNKPVQSVDNIWLNVVDTFAPVSLDYIQLDGETGTLKILPDFTTYVQTTLPMFAYGDTSNIWIRYTTGYATEDVPAMIKKVTALAVDYLFGLDNLTPNIESFSTQTYSQKNSKGDKDSDPILSRIEQLIADYKHITII